MKFTLFFKKKAKFNLNLNNIFKSKDNEAFKVVQISIKLDESKMSTTVIRLLPKLLDEIVKSLAKAELDGEKFDSLAVALERDGYSCYIPGLHPPESISKPKT